METLSSIRKFVLCIDSIPHTLKRDFVKQFGGGGVFG
jgi:hypothetical protein